MRATHAETHSPYFPAAVLKHHLRPLESRLAEVDQSRPDLLADHLGTAATLPAVITEVQTRAANLLTRRQEIDTPPERYRLQRTPRRTRGHTRSFPR